MTASAIPTTNSPAPTKNAWTKIVARYNHSVRAISIWQMVNSFGPFFALTILAYLVVHTSFWLALPLSILAGMFLMRIFIIQHDCGHQSFFKSKKANDRVGFFCGILTMTPYAYWRMTHAEHHATSGDLDYRGIGDIETKTVAEYVKMTPWQRLSYRLYRFPLITFGLGPLWVFMFVQRTPLSWKFARTQAAKRSLIITDAVLVAIWLPMLILLGPATVLMVQVPMWIVSTSMGVWLFYVQHNFEETYWRNHPQWTFEEAAMLGSSYYKLPKILQWFSGNIGLHHIHHLSPKIPNYLLQQAQDENEYFQTNIHILTLRTSLEVLTSRVALWDENLQKMVSFAYVHRTMPEALKQAAMPTTAAVSVSAPAAGGSD